MNRSFRRTIAPAMLALLGTLAALARASADAAKDSAPRAVHHYVFFNRDRERIAEPTFIQTKAIEGAQLKYSWRELEQGKDEYDFGDLRRDLALLKSKGKK